MLDVDQFLSTPSARRATPSGHFLLRADAYFYPRPPRGGRRCLCTVHSGKCSDFYPRPPRGGRLFCKAVCASRPSISIHALREEGDRPRTAASRFGPNFYPRPPRGGRLRPCAAPDFALQFLSTPSARRATPELTYGYWAAADFYPRPPRGGRPAAQLPAEPDLTISIHALREEGDGCWG